MVYIFFCIYFKIKFSSSLNYSVYHLNYYYARYRLASIFCCCYIYLGYIDDDDGDGKKEKKKFKFFTSNRKEEYHHHQILFALNIEIFFRRNSWILEKEKLLLLLLWSTELYFDVCKKNSSSSFKRSKTLCYSVGWINRLYRSYFFQWKILYIFIYNLSNLSYYHWYIL